MTFINIRCHREICLLSFYMSVFCWFAGILMFFSDLFSYIMCCWSVLITLFCDCKIKWNDQIFHKSLRWCVAQQVNIWHPLLSSVTSFVGVPKQFERDIFFQASVTSFVVDQATIWNGEMFLCIDHQTNDLLKYISLSQLHCVPLMEPNTEIAMYFQM